MQAALTEALAEVLQPPPGRERAGVVEDFLHADAGEMLQLVQVVLARRQREVRQQAVPRAEGAPPAAVPGAAGYGPAPPAVAAGRADRPPVGADLQEVAVAVGVEPPLRQFAVDVGPHRDDLGRRRLRAGVL